MESEGYADRLRELEREQSASLARLAGVECQQRAMWTELRRVSREGRDELHALRIEAKADTERLLAAIMSNKIAWSTMSGGSRAAAWIIGTLVGLAGIMAAAGSFIYRLVFAHD